MYSQTLTPTFINSIQVARRTKSALIKRRNQVRGNHA